MIRNLILSTIAAAGLAGRSAALGPMSDLCLPISSTALLEATVFRHFQEALGCKHLRKVPAVRIQREEAAGILEGCSRGWPGDPQAPYRLLALMLTEGKGFTRATSSPPESTWGPCCVTVDETRITARTWGIPCPRTRDAIRKRHEEDPRWSMIVAAGTVWRYEQAAGGDRMRAILIFKYGAAGLARALDRQGPEKGLSDLWEWVKYARYLTWIECLQTRVLTGTPPPDCICWPVMSE